MSVLAILEMFQIVLIVLHFQPIVKVANLSMVEPLLGLLKTLHLEVQYEGRKIIVQTSLFSATPNLTYD